MVKQNAQVRMKALVAARLLMGDLDTWAHFEEERKIARQVANRRIARSVSAQIGRRYSDLSRETKSFISRNFDRCDYDDLARLCDEVPSGRGIYMRLDEFEDTFSHWQRESRVAIHSTRMLRYRRMVSNSSIRSTISLKI